MGGGGGVNVGVLDAPPCDIKGLGEAKRSVTERTRLLSGEQHHPRRCRHPTRVPLASSRLTQPMTGRLLFKARPGARNPNSSVPPSASFPSPLPLPPQACAEKPRPLLATGDVAPNSWEEKKPNKPHFSILQAFSCEGGKTAFPLPRYWLGSGLFFPYQDNL